MVIKIKDVLNMNGAIAKLRDATLPIRTAYSLKKFLKAVTTEMEFFEETKKDIFNKYVAKGEDDNILVNEDGKNYIAEENLKPYFEDMESLVNSEIEIVDFKIKLSELDGIVNTNDLLALDLIIDEDLD